MRKQPVFVAKATGYTGDQAHQLVLLLDAAGTDTCNICLNPLCAGPGRCNTDDIYSDLAHTDNRFVKDGLFALAMEYKKKSSSGIQRSSPASFEQVLQAQAHREPSSSTYDWDSWQPMPRDDWHSQQNQYPSHANNEYDQHSEWQGHSNQEWGDSYPNEGSEYDSFGNDPYAGASSKEEEDPYWENAAYQEEQVYIAYSEQNAHDENLQHDPPADDWDEEAIVSPPSHPSTPTAEEKPNSPSYGPDGWTN